MERERLEKRLRARIAVQREKERHNTPVINVCDAGQYAQLLHSQLEADAKARALLEAAGFVYIRT